MHMPIMQSPLLLQPQVEPMHFWPFVEFMQSDAVLHPHAPPLHPLPAGSLVQSRHAPPAVTHVAEPTGAQCPELQQKPAPQGPLPPSPHVSLQVPPDPHVGV
jgi:hypothetical protein